MFAPLKCLHIISLMMLNEEWYSFIRNAKPLKLSENAYSLDNWSTTINEK